MLKYLLLLVGLLLVSKEMVGQQLPQYSHYMLNPLLLNPAVAGADNYLDIRSGYRKQWVGLEGAPSTYYLSAHMPIFRRAYLNAPTPYHQEPQPKRSKYLENWRPSHRNTYQKVPANHGVGMLAQMDQAGGLKRTDVQAVYAYHLPLSNRLKMAAGIAAGLTQYSLNHELISFTDPNDPVAQDADYNRIRPNLSVGVIMYSNRFFGGVSLAQIIPASFSFKTTTPDVPAEQQRHVFAHVGYRWSVSNDIQVIPSVVVKYADATALSFDVNAKVYLKNFMWLGGSYRHDDAMVASAGIHLKQMLHLGYSYDLNTSHLSTVSTGSHEIMLGLTLLNKQAIFSKAQYW